MKLSLSFLFLSCVAAFAQQLQSDCYQVQVAPWTNHDFPPLIKPHLPILPGNEKDGVHLFIRSNCTQTPATLLIRLAYTTAAGEKRVFSDIAIMNRSEETGDVGGYMVAVIGKGVTVRGVVVTPIWPVDQKEEEGK